MRYPNISRGNYKDFNKCKVIKAWPIVILNTSRIRALLILRPINLYLKGKVISKGYITLWVLKFYKISTMVITYFSLLSDSVNNDATNKILVRTRIKTLFQYYYK